MLLEGTSQDKLIEIATPLMPNHADKIPARENRKMLKSFGDNAFAFSPPVGNGSENSRFTNLRFMICLWFNRMLE
jgi:hypothetical protein